MLHTTYYICYVLYMYLYIRGMICNIYPTYTSPTLTPFCLLCPLIPPLKPTLTLQHFNT